jgi:CMP-N,N'-diacetyllegionaminic acid synthase
MSDFVGILAIRRGSKGVVDKNRRVFNGEPLYSIAIKRFENLGLPYIVSTDFEIDELEGIAAKDFLKRNNRLATDDSHIFNVIEDVIIRRGLEEKVIVLVQATSPLIEGFHLKEAMNNYTNNNGNYMVASVVVTEKEILKQGIIHKGLFEPVNKRDYCFSNRQSLPQTYKMTGGVYVFAAKSFIKDKGMHKMNILPLVIDAKYALDIDNEIDLANENWKTRD